MSKFYVTYSKAAVAAKPTNVGQTPEDRKKPQHIAYHQSGWNYVAALMDVETFYKVPTSGHSFRQATYSWTFKSYTKEKRFLKTEALGTNLIILDFDKSPYTPELMVKLAAERVAEPNFWYYSFSQGIKEAWNYRMVWVLDSTILTEEYEGYIAAMLDLFPEADPAAKDISRLWFGGRPGAFISGEMKDIDLFPFTSTPKKFVLDKYGNTTPHEIDKIYLDELLNVTKYDWISPLKKHWPLFNRYVNSEYLNFGERAFLFGQVFSLYEEDIPMFYLMFNLPDTETYAGADYFNVNEIERMYKSFLREDKLKVAKMKTPIVYMEQMAFGDPQRRAFYSVKDFIQHLIKVGDIKTK